MAFAHVKMHWAKMKAEKVAIEDITLRVTRQEGPGYS